MLVIRYVGNKIMNFWVPQRPEIPRPAERLLVS